jgi:hypothetical protein
VTEGTGPRQCRRKVDVQALEREILAGELSDVSLVILAGKLFRDCHQIVAPTTPMGLPFEIWQS